MLTAKHIITSLIIAIALFTFSHPSLKPENNARHLAPYFSIQPKIEQQYNDGNDLSLASEQNPIPKSLFNLAVLTSNGQYLKANLIDDILAPALKITFETMNVPQASRLAVFSMMGSITYMRKNNGTPDWENIDDFDFDLLVKDGIKTIDMRQLFRQALIARLQDMGIEFEDDGLELSIRIKDKSTPIALGHRYTDPMEWQPGGHYLPLINSYFAYSPASKTYFDDLVATVNTYDEAGYYLDSYLSLLNNALTIHLDNPKIFKRLALMAHYRGRNGAALDLLKVFRIFKDRDLTDPATKKAFETARTNALTLLGYRPMLRNPKMNTLREIDWNNIDHELRAIRDEIEASLRPTRQSLYAVTQNIILGQAA